MNLEDIVKDWLTQNGYDGLCNIDEKCDCTLEDLMPCSEPDMNCKAGHCLSRATKVGFIVADDEMNGTMKEGDKIRVFTYIMGHRTGTKDLVVEKFRHCLGVFESELDRTASNFTPLCDLYRPGPDSEQKYIPNYGEYHTNMVQVWMDLP